MPAGVYNIRAEQGSNFSLHIRYSDDLGQYVDMSDFSPRMQVRRSPNKDNVLLFITEQGVTGGGTASSGEFEVGSGGVSGVSGFGISKNVSVQGLTGQANSLGGLMIDIDPQTMSNCPYGNHFYDLELESNLNGSVTRLLQGRFSVDREITR